MSQHVLSLKTYLAVYVALLVLLLLTVAATAVEGPILGNVTAMAIAIAKVVLIMLYFMHVKFSSAMVRLFAISGFLGLILLLLMTAADYLTRLEVL